MTHRRCAQLDHKPPPLPGSARAHAESSPLSAMPADRWVARPKASLERLQRRVERMPALLHGRVQYQGIDGDRAMREPRRQHRIRVSEKTKIAGDPGSLDVAAPVGTLHRAGRAQDACRQIGVGARPAARRGPPRTLSAIMPAPPPPPRPSRSTRREHAAGLGAFTCRRRPWVPRSRCQPGSRPQPAIDVERCGGLRGLLRQREHIGCVRPRVAGPGPPTAGGKGVVAPLDPQRSRPRHPMPGRPQG